jgi:hypothetical protein
MAINGADSFYFQVWVTAAKAARNEVETWRWS